MSDPFTAEAATFVPAVADKASSQADVGGGQVVLWAPLTIAPFAGRDLSGASQTASVVGCVQDIDHQAVAGFKG
jgi:hypothetical protein